MSCCCPLLVHPGAMEGVSNRNSDLKRTFNFVVSVNIHISSRMGFHNSDLCSSIKQSNPHVKLCIWIKQSLSVDRMKLGRRAHFFIE